MQIVPTKTPSRPAAEGGRDTHASDHTPLPHHVRPAPAAANLRPKEHGAYAILAIPLATALLIAGVSIVAGLVALASVAGFLAHEPLLVAWGHRGRRAQGLAPRAKMRLVLRLATAIGCGCGALGLGSSSVRLALLGCVFAAGIGLLIAIGGRHRSLVGQLWGVLALSMPAVPVALAGGLDWTTSWMLWWTWLLGFLSTTMAVRGVIAAQKRQPRWSHMALLTATTVGSACGYAFYAPWTLAIMPMIVASWYLIWIPPPAKQLRSVGWTLVAATVMTAVFLVASMSS